MSKHKSLFGLVAAVAVCMSVILSPIAARADPPGDGLSLSVTPGVLTASLGENVSYSFVISSICNTTIDALVLTDDRLGTISLPSTSIAPGENITASAVHTVALADFPGPLLASATVAGTSAIGDNYTASAASSVALNPLTASLEVSMSADRSSASVGDNITYTYAVVNTGQAAFSGLVLTDSRLGAIALSAGSLASHASATGSAIYKVLTADLPGPLVSSATVTAVDAAGQTLTATSEAVSVTLSAEDDDDEVNDDDDDEVNDNDDDDNGNNDDDDSRLTKGEWHRERGVPGKGIDDAPGQQKFFNFNWGGDDHGKGSLERERENERGNGKQNSNKNQNKNKNGEDD
jgi:hypothetical protein